MSDRNYPIILRVYDKPNKVCIGTRSGSGCDISILGLKPDYKQNPELCTNEELAEMLDGHVYITLHFCNRQALHKFIKMLQQTDDLWDGETE